MKLGIEYIFVIVAFVAVIMMASYGSAVVAYQKEELFPRHFAYEGMESEVKGNVKSDMKSEKEKSEKEKSDMNSDMTSENMKSTPPPSGIMKKKESAKKSESFAGMSPYNVNSENMKYENMKSSQPPPGIMKKKESAKKPESFKGMSPYNVNTPETTLDPLSQIQGSRTCDFNSALGFSNSMGPLCIDDSTMKLLRTRGGNQSGVPSQIG